jgi:cell division transport system permease protein
MARRSDLPLAGDESSRFIPWIEALMVYLATLALAGALAAGSAVERWSRGLAGSLTVQIMPGAEADTGALKQRVAAATALLEATPGIARAEALSDERIAKLLEPWLGAAGIRELPLPALIDVRLKPGARIDVAALAAEVAKKVPGASLDDHQRWLRELITLGRSVELVAVLVLALIAAAGATATVFSTRTALAIHHGVIEVMHLIGAQDSYVARQFQAHALAIALRGGAVGFAAAVLTVLAVRMIAGEGGVALAPALSLAPWQWASLAAPPILTALIAMLTARATVLGALARMV